MPKLLQINPVLRLSTSTGRIMREIGEVAMNHGWESYVAYSYGRDSKMLSTSQLVPVGNKWDVALHGFITRLFDRHGLSSVAATKRFIDNIERLNPDIIHIHNIHGYFLNYKLFFSYLAAKNKKVIWTVHDCWLYTGHCYYYSAAGCQRWQSGCGNCPQRGEFPRSWLIDRSARNFQDKRAAFTSLLPENFVIVPVSEWIRSEMSKSFFKDYEFRVIHNGINLDVFSPKESSAARLKYDIKEPIIYLGLASIWLQEKGLPDFLRMAGLLGADERIVLVGKMPKNTIKRLPANITYIPRTENVTELAALYSASSVFINPTWQDNYPTVNLEALACGTPVVTYNTGGSPESLTPQTGRVIEQGDVEGLLSAAREFASMDRDSLREACRSHALANFAKLDRYTDYLNLYEEMMAR